MIDLLPEKLLSLPRKQAEKEFNALPVTRQAMMTLMAPWEKRQELMLLSENFQELVRSIPVEELFWTIKATGTEDCLQTISACSFDQLQFIIDLDWWERDKFRLDRIAAWLILLFEAGEETAGAWTHEIMQKDPYLIPAAMRHFLKVQKRPDDMELEEARDLLYPFTIDNTYYILFTSDKLEALWARVIMKLLEVSPGFYRNCMETILTETRTECAEMAWKLRCGRLADYGIPDYFTALDIYAPIRPESIRYPYDSVQALPATDTDDMPAFVPTLYMSGFPALNSSMEQLVDTPYISRIIREWTGVANKIIMADLTDLDEPEALKHALEKTAAMINLGIEVAEEKKGTPPGSIMKRAVLEDIVRVAMWPLKALRTRAQKLAAQADIKMIPEEYSNRFISLAARFPKLWDHELHQTTHFSTMAQIHEMEHMLAELESWQKIMKNLKPHWSRWRETLEWERTNFLSYAEFTWQHGLATAIANFILEGTAVIVPVPASMLGELRDRVASGAWQKIIAHTAEETARLADLKTAEAHTILEKAAGPMIEELETMNNRKQPDGRFISSFLVETTNDVD